MRSLLTQRAGAIAALVAVLNLAVSCAHTTRFATDPEGAMVSVNGRPVSVSPAIYMSRSGVPSTYFVKVEKEGYKTQELTLESSYRADISLLLLLAAIVPYFFSARLEDEYKMPLQPLEPAK